MSRKAAGPPTLSILKQNELVLSSSSLLSRLQTYLCTLELVGLSKQHTESGSIVTVLPCSAGKSWPDLIFSSRFGERLNLSGVATTLS